MIKLHSSQIKRVLSGRLFQGTILVALSLCVMLIIFNHTNTVTVRADETSTVLVTMKQDPKAIATQAGVVLGENDRVTVAETKGGQFTLQVDRAVDITVTADGVEQQLLMYEGDDVEDALRTSGISLGDEDILNMALSAELTDGASIQLKRVTYNEVTYTEPVAYTTVTEKNNSLEKGIRKVTQKGVNGVRTITVREKLVDGVVESTQELSNEITTQPVDRIVQVGTKVVSVAPNTKRATILEDGTLIDHEGNVVSYKSYKDGKATAYTASEGTTWTATGGKVCVGTVAVNPKVIPYGTRLYICSADGSFVYGYGVAADTGGALLSGRVLADVYYDTLAECNAFGRRNIRVYILN